MSGLGTVIQTRKELTGQDGGLFCRTKIPGTWRAVRVGLSGGPEVPKTNVSDPPLVDGE